ncbi:MAG: PQQ-dependent sugar dehydrogenase [Saprospiraceae bacterium]
MKILLKFVFPILISSFFFNKNKVCAHGLPPGFAAIQVAEGLDPVCMSLAPDGRIFFTEKNGRVRIVENDQLLTDPFIEIEVDNFNERGLSGIAIDPDFDNSPYVYLYYTVPGEDHNRLSRFLATGNFAVPGSEEILLEIDSLHGPNHNAGALSFAEDGTLFVAVGDGRSINAAQELNSLLGKILRINKDGSIPTDNPFYNETFGKYRAIWSLGHRNPFAMHYEPGTNRLFTTDVGSHRFEEINEIFAGKNYGWPKVEGDYQDQVPPANYVAPLHFYNHDMGCAAVGVTTYHPDDRTFPSEYWDKLFFSDYCNGKILTLNPLNGEIADFATDINRPLNLLVAPDGTLYYLARAGFGDGSDEDNTTSSNGTLWRIFYTGNDAPFIAVQPKDRLVSVGETAIFEIAVSGADPLQFKWQVNGSNVNAPNSPVFVFENAMLVDSGSLIRCIVTNIEGSDTTRTATLQVTANQRPVLNLSQPAEGVLYKAGDKMIFSGTATDPEEGSLPPSNLTWKIDFHHAEHTHPAYGPIGGIESDSFVIAKNGEVSEDVWFRINFTARDGQGLTKTEHRLVYPLKSTISVETKPPGLPVDVDGTLNNAPFPTKSVVGVIHDFSVPLTAVTDDSLYVFKEWNTGQIEVNIAFEAPENDFVLTAEYEAVQALSEGQGLIGTYYDDPLKNFTFQEPYFLRRLDPTIDFDWGLASPNEEYLGNEFFVVRWEGYIKPLFTDTFNLHLITNDGSRLWIDNQLVIDKWFGQGTNEYSAQLLLEAEKYYPIRLEFFEGIGDAKVQLLWSSPQVERSIVPSSQLFPALPVPPFMGEELEVSVFPNPVTDFLTLQFGSPANTTMQVTIFNAAGQMVISEKKEIEEGRSEATISFKDLANGVYFVKLSGDLISQSFEIIKH